MKLPCYYWSIKKKKNHQPSAKNDLLQAKKMIKMVERITKERNDQSKFEDGGYSTPKLNMDKLSAMKTFIKTLFDQKNAELESETEKAINIAITLFIDAAIQVAFSRKLGSRVAEDSESLQQVGKMLSAGWEYINKQAKEKLSIVCNVSKEIAKKQGDPALSKLRDQEIVDSLDNLFKVAIDQVDSDYSILFSPSH